ncbi:MAG: hypothetical protein M3012_07835 [Staphylococcus epidermidis]|nr:hypothetical protein [Staphylococcus epidermidis]MCT6858975.1 hypothetical protein [Apilactobacillus sp.]
MKKLSIIGFTLIAIVTLSACSNSKTKQKADQSNKATKYVKLVNEDNQTKLITKKGKITFYKTYRGTSYDNNGKKRFDMVMYSFKATNNTSKMLTAGQIVHNTKLIATVNENGGTKKLDQPLAYSSAYTNKNANEQAKLNRYEQSWENEPIRPHQTIIVTSPDAFPLINNGNNENLVLVTQDNYTKKSVISQKHNKLSLSQIHAKKVNKAIDIVK